MKKIRFLALFFVFGIAFSSCIKDDNPITDNENVVKDDNSTNQDKDQTNDDAGNSDDGAEGDEKPDIDEGGMYIECTPGETRECFEGPTGSKGVGICVAGIATCVIDGTDWSECVGQVLPAPEICGDGIDQNCDGEDTTVDNVIDIDGDGYNYCNGDCCETSWDCKAEEPDRVNSGAYEFDDNYIDDNCNGKIDEKESCDESLALALNDYPGNAEKLAKAMGICSGLVSAEISLSGEPVSELIADNQCGGENGSYTKADRPSLTMPYYDANYQTFAVSPMFGTAMTPLEGVQLAVLSTADWDNPTMDAACATLDAGDMKTSSTIPEDWINMMPNCEIPKAPSCGGQAPQTGLTNQCAGKTIPSVQDPIMLTIKMKVPSNARAFEFNLFFMSIEYPGTVCSSSNYNDFFVALIDSTYNEKNPGAEYMNPYDKNLAKDEFGNPVGVDLAPAGLFKACSTTCTAMGSNTNKWGFCTGDEILAGTGFQASGTGMFCTGHGGTGWLKTTGNVEPGEEMILRLALWEQGEVGYGPDHSYDSTVVLDGFKWLPRPGKPGTQEK